jgi:hypothetical protein
MATSPCHSNDRSLRMVFQMTRTSQVWRLNLPRKNCKWRALVVRQVELGVVVVLH